MIRVGLVGAGFMAETHLEAYRNGDDATVAAVASPNTADSFVAEQGIDAETYADVGAMLDNGNVDAIDVCSPTPTHRRYVEAALERELPVLCEKPIAGTLADARAMARAADEAEVPLMIGHVLRFFPQYRTARESVQSGDIGAPGVARARRLSPFPEWGHGDWYRTGSGGPLVDLAIHDFDFLRWTFGEVERAFARSTDAEDPHVHAVLRFENGAVGHVEGSWAQPEGTDLESELELAGEDGLIELGDGAPLVHKTAGGRTVESPLAAGGYRRQLEAFAECVREGTDPPVTADDAIEALRIALAARQSVADGDPVAVREVGP